MEDARGPPEGTAEGVAARCRRAPGVCQWADATGWWGAAGEELRHGEAA